jgi:hypothetical protein
MVKRRQIYVEMDKASEENGRGRVHGLFRIDGADCGIQGVTRRCRLAWLTNSALVSEPKCGGKVGSCGVSASKCSCAHRAQINF